MRFAIVSARIEQGFVSHYSAASFVYRETVIVPADDILARIGSENCC